jgi:anthranilate synthase component 2
VYRNDEFDIDEIAGFDKIYSFSWSWSSDEAGLLKDVIRNGATKFCVSWAASHW